jgi:hypothetical protein
VNQFSSTGDEGCRTKLEMDDALASLAASARERPELVNPTPRCARDLRVYCVQLVAMGSLGWHLEAEVLRVLDMACAGETEPAFRECLLFRVRIGGDGKGMMLLWTQRAMLGCTLIERIRIAEQTQLRYVCDMSALSVRSVPRGATHRKSTIRLPHTPACFASSVTSPSHLRWPFDTSATNLVSQPRSHTFDTGCSTIVISDTRRAEGTLRLRYFGFNAVCPPCPASHCRLSVKRS